jgi:hypothetical protein
MSDMTCEPQHRWFLHWHAWLSKQEAPGGLVVVVVVVSVVVVVVDVLDVDVLVLVFVVNV